MTTDDDGQRVLLETDYDSGTQSETDLRYFVYGNYIDEVLIMADIDGGAVNTITDGDYTFAHDHLYSPEALFDEDGTVVERYEYDAYGELKVPGTFNYPCGSIDHVRIEITWQLTGSINVGIGPIGFPVHTFPVADIKTHTFKKDVKCCK